MSQSNKLDWDFDGTNMLKSYDFQPSSMRKSPLSNKTKLDCGFDRVLDFR